jgi:hypothetical protein
VNRIRARDCLAVYRDFGPSGIGGKSPEKEMTNVARLAQAGQVFRASYGGWWSRWMYCSMGEGDVVPACLALESSFNYTAEAMESLLT